MTYRKSLVFIATVLCLMSLTKSSASNIVKKVSVSVNTTSLEKADVAFNKALESKDETLKTDYLNQARDLYYFSTTSDLTNIYPVIQLARIYDLQNNNRYAKSYFSRALAMDYKNVNANLYFGDYFYRRNEYRKALRFYRKAFENGLKESNTNLCTMADIYQKLGDLYKSELYYKKAYLLNPTDENIPDKIRELEQIKYKNSEYYKRGNKK